MAEIFHLNEEDKRLLFEARYGTASILPLYNVPFERNPYFTGREKLLQQLHEQLTARKQIALKQAISGLGGAGKTQIAVEYANRFRESYHDILWVAADSLETFTASYVKLAELLHLREKDLQDWNLIVAAVKRWLSTHKEWLLILDNVEDLSLVSRFVPSGRQGAVLLTTQRQVTERVSQVLEVDMMPEEEGARFLLRRAHYLKLGALLNETASDDRSITTAKTISRELCGLPLALDQAGAYILETGCSLADYLALYRQRREELLQRRGSIDTDHPESVTTTFSLAFDRLIRKNTDAAELLRLFAFLAPDTIPEEIFLQGGPYFSANLQSLVGDGLAFNDAIEALRTFSLIYRDREEKTFNVHRLVQAVLQDAMAEQERRRWVEQAVRAVNVAMRNAEAKPSSRPADLRAWSHHRERYLPHLRACARVVNDCHAVSSEAAELLDRFAYELSFSLESYNIDEIIDALHKALTMWEEVLGPDDLHIVDCLTGLILQYRMLGGHKKEAEELVRRRADIERRTDPEVLKAFPFRVKIVSGLTPPDQITS